MANPVVLCADITCDIGPELTQELGVQLYPSHVLLGDDSYRDGIDLTPEDVFRIYNEKKILPRTAAINVQEYVDFFAPFVEAGNDVVHITLGSGLSSAHQNCRIAAEEFEGRVQVVDSCNLSSGSGHLVLEAARLIREGRSAEEIAAELKTLVNKVSASFVIDTLEFLYKGGRCSALEMFGANLLKLKPSIRVSTTDGHMDVGKKYRGSLDKVLEEYVRDELEGRDDLRLDKIFITHTTISQERVDKVRELILKYQPFEKIYDTTASCTISAHCGPNTLGILFMTK
ncbi:MAG: DegV family protein [Clostridia bacterium]|nr:DegV family protein [Clostridia bacterium]